MDARAQADELTARLGPPARPLHIWMMQIGEPSPFDAQARLHRTGSLCVALIARGHRVTWWSSAFDHFTKTWLRTDLPIRPDLRAVSFSFFKGLGYRRNVSLRRLLDHRLIAWQVGRTLRNQPRPDIIVASLPAYDIANAFVSYAWRRHVPVVVDIRDPWPDIFAKVFPARLRWAAPGFLARERAIYNSCVRRASALMSVTDSMLQHALQCAGRRPQPMDEVLHNWYHRGVATAPVTDTGRQVLTLAKGRFVAAFVGSFGDAHDPRQLVAAARQADPDRVYFVMAGDGHLRQSLETMAGDLRHVRFTGWLDEPAMRDILGLAQVGVCPTPFESDLLPNKAILHLAAGRPIISAFGGDLRSLIDRYGCGINYPPGAAPELAAAIRGYADNPAAYAAAAAAAQRAFAQEFDSANLIPRYIEKLETMATRASRD